VYQPTQVTREKAEGAKAYIERKYAKLKNEEKEKKEGKSNHTLLVEVVEPFLNGVYS